MRHTKVFLFASAALLASPAIAADALKFGAAPGWLHPQAVPTAKPTEAPIQLLLDDDQSRLERGKIVRYHESAMRIVNAQGLAAGNVALVWQPATDTVTVNKLQILRGGKAIDVLASGQTFTVLRRETNLEAATLDGTLTATLQPEGLQEGDIIDLATTTERSDPVLKGHVEAMFGGWDGLPIAAAHAALSWPGDLHLTLRQTPNLPAAQRTSGGGSNLLELSAKDIQPLVPPKGAPERFQIGRLAEASDFASWADLANLFVPLFRDASVIPASGPLHDEIERIRAGSTDPKVRAARALALVQDRVRYVALLMGQGGYVPAPAETTWSRRFGDCKAKTALLLGILHSLGIQAEPVLVKSTAGDMISDRLPMIGLFDHVLARAHIDGKDYCLDGTRTGDSDLDAIEVPAFGWGLPVVDHAALVRMVPAPLDRPQSDTDIAIDATAGIYTPAEISVVQVLRGDIAVTFNSGLVSLTDTQRKQFFDEFWKKIVDDQVSGVSSYTFDKASRELRMSMQGKLVLDWSGGFFHLPMSSIGYTPDLDRPEGPLHDAPVAVSYPLFDRAETKLRLPTDFFSSNISSRVPAPVHQTLIGIEYSRVQSATPNTMTVQTTTRSLVPEVSYKDAVAASSSLKALAYGDVSVRLPASYHATAADLSALKANPVGSSEDLVSRGNTLNDSGAFQDAVAMFDKALELDSNNVTALADRAIAYTWMRKFDLAKKDIDVALAIDSTNAVALRARGLGAELTSDWSRAIEAYTASLGAEPQNNFAIGHRAICEAAASKNDEALADSAAALKSNNSWIELRVLRANILYKKGRTDDVANEAKLVTAENPQSTYAFVAAARIYARINRNAEAMKAFDTALAIKPEAYIYVNRAQSRPFTDRIGHLADLEAALKIEPKNVDALAEKAEELASEGDNKAALQIYGQVIKAQPDSSYYNFRYAVLQFKTGNVSEGKRLLAVEDAKAKTANDFNSLCWGKATAGILIDEALNDCHEALKRDPDAGGYIDSLAFVELRLGRVDEAITDYDRAIAKNAGAASYMGRAIAYAKKGNKTQANADLAQALKLDSNEQTRFAEFGLTIDQAAAVKN